MAYKERFFENDTETVAIPNPMNFTGSVAIAGLVNPLTASKIVITDGSGVLTAADTGTYPSLTELSYSKGLTSAAQTQINTKAPIASPTFTGTVTSPAAILSSETASTIASFDASKNIKSLDTATYPSLSELAHVKGATSAFQTQINTKAPSAAPAFTGLVKLTPQELTASGAITSSFCGLNHATVAIAATLAAPTAGQLAYIVDTSASGTAAHTVTLPGGVTFDGTNNTATFDAPNEALYMIARSATRWQIILNVGAVALSSV